MSKRNGNRSRSHVQRRHKAALRLSRRELLPGSKPAEKIVSISSKKTVASDR